MEKCACAASLGQARFDCLSKKYTNQAFVVRSDHQRLGAAIWMGTKHSTISRLQQLLGHPRFDHVVIGMLSPVRLELFPLGKRTRK